MPPSDSKITTPLDMTIITLSNTEINGKTRHDVTAVLTVAFWCETVILEEVAIHLYVKYDICLTKDRWHRPELVNSEWWEDIDNISVIIDFCMMHAKYFIYPKKY